MYCKTNQEPNGVVLLKTHNAKSAIVEDTPITWHVMIRKHYMAHKTSNVKLNTVHISAER